MPNAFEILKRDARDAANGWSLGVFGAIAEFMRDESEPCIVQEEPERLDLVTARGGLRIEAHPEVVILDYRTPSRHVARRVPARAVCLPAAAAQKAGRTTITELGPDADALRGEDRDAILFDLGIGLDAVEACVRTSNRHLLAALRAAEGQEMLAVDGLMPVLLASQPHRVFQSRLGRIEVFQPIPPPDGRSPQGPHTHVMPRLLAHRRTHAASVPIPAGLVPCLSVHPPAGADSASGRA